MRHTLPFRLSKEQHAVMRVLAVFAVLAALIANGLAVIPGPTPAQAQTQNIPVSPAKRDFANSANQNTYTFTVDADATLNSLDFNVTGTYQLRKYDLMVNGRSLKKEAFSPPFQKLPYSKTITGLNSALKRGNEIKLILEFNYPREKGTVSITPRGTLGGSTPTPTPTPTSTPDPSDKTVTPAAPTAVDPKTAAQCVEKGYINIPDTKGVDYYIAGQEEPAGQYFVEGNKRATVKVTAKAQPGYQIASGAKTEWSFDMSGEVKNCSGDQLTPPPEGRTFKAKGHGFSLQGDPVNSGTPNVFTAKVGEDAKLNYITVRIKTDATFLNPQHYQLTVDKIEDGVTLQKRNVKIGDGYITMDVVPMKNGKQVDSAVLPKDAVFTFTNNLAENKSLEVELDAYGTKSADPTDPPIISPPDGAEWVHGRVANPSVPMTCGLRIAVVADLSTSLRYADVNGFEATKTATSAFIDALAGTPAELGIYNFASSAPANGAGSTVGNNPPYISMQTEAGVNQAKRVVENWAYNPGNSGTNWQAGLQQVKAGNYDVVYFITDGMPTTSSTIKSKGIGAEFVQASALNDAIAAANELKKAGTRVVPLMVDLTLGGRSNNQRPVVKNDLVLKDAKRIAWTADPGQAPGIYYKIRSDHPKALHANYINTDTLANLKMAYDAAGSQTLQVFERMPNGRQETITLNQSRWTYGTRDVKQMGEDISGTGDTVRIEGYGKLAAQMKSMAQDLTKKCNGEVIVKKRIVDENGKVLSDGEPGWEFTLSANGQKVIDPGNGSLVTQWRKVTSSRDEDRGTARWGIQSEEEQKLTLVESQQPGYSLYKRDNANAVCHETREGNTVQIPVQNVGEFGFTVNMSEEDKKLSRVSCVVDNYKTPEAKGKLTFKKAQYKDGKITEMPGLGGATFEIYPAKDGKPDYSAGKPLYTIKPGQESIEVKTTGTFFLVETKAPKGLNLLPHPVKFEIAMDQNTEKYTISAGTSNGLITTSGTGEAMILTVVDTASGTLPKTGGNGVVWWAAGGLAIVAAGALLMYRRRA